MSFVAELVFLFVLGSLGLTLLVVTGIMTYEFFRSRHD